MYKVSQIKRICRMYNWENENKFWIFNDFSCFPNRKLWKSGNLITFLRVYYLMYSPFIITSTPLWLQCLQGGYYCSILRIRSLALILLRFGWFIPAENVAPIVWLFTHHHTSNAVDRKATVWFLFYVYVFNLINFIIQAELHM